MYFSELQHVAVINGEYIFIIKILNDIRFRCLDNYSKHIKTIQICVAELYIFIIHNLAVTFLNK